MIKMYWRIGWLGVVVFVAVVHEHCAQNLHIYEDVHRRADPQQIWFQNSLKFVLGKLFEENKCKECLERRGEFRLANYLYEKKRRRFGSPAWYEQSVKNLARTMHCHLSCAQIIVDRIAETNRPPTIRCPDSITVSAERRQEGDKLLGRRVHWNEPTATDLDGDRLIFYSDDEPSGSFFTAGHHKIRYEVNDHKGGKDNCEFSIHVDVIRCRRDLLVNHGKNSCHGKSVVYGDRCTISCDPGYQLVGSGNLVCQYEGDYSSSQPSCEEKTCDSILPKPEHGVLSCNQWVRGELCSLECDTGYLPPRGYEKMWVCSHETGRWKPSVVPKCIPEVKPIGLKLLVRLKISTNCTDKNTAIPDTVRKFIMLSDGILSHCISCELSKIKTTCTPHSALMKLHFVIDVGNDTVEAYQSQLIDVADGMDNVLKRTQYIPGIQSTRIVLSKSSPRFVCPEGFDPNGNACAGCSPGTKFLRQNTSCTLCPQGSYQDKVGQFSCERCPAGTYTQHTGSDKKTDCRIIRCRRDLLVNHGKNSCHGKRVVYGDRCTISCDPGYQLVGSGNLECLHNGDYSSSQPSCEVIRCRRDLLVNHGTNSCHGKRVVYGDRCTISCDPGFQLVGSGNLECQHNGDYSSSQPSCEAIMCPELRLPVGGLNYNCTKGRRYESHCYLLCDRERGFRLVRTKEDKLMLYPGTTECLEDATWSSQRTCRVIRCRTLFVNHGKNSCHGKRVVHGDRCTISCDPGFQLVGSGNIECQNNGDYSSLQPSCEVQHCKPPRLTDPYMTFNCTPNLILGAECSFSCLLGLTLTGSSNAYCETKNDTLSWTWSKGKPPSCEKKTCGSLPKPEHGVLSCDMLFGGEMCSLECDTGYLPPRGYTRIWVCYLKIGRRWEPSVDPKCIPEVKPIGLKLPVMLKIITDCTDEKTAIISDTVRTFIMLSDGILSHCISCELSEIKTTCTPDSALMTLHFVIEVGSDTVEAYQNRLINVADGIDNVLKRTQTIPGIQSTRIIWDQSYPRFVCPEGFEPNGNACAGCSPGTRFFRQTKICTLCPQGSYQDKVGQFRCERCPAGTDTLSSGSDNKNDCREKCNPGTYSDTGLKPCILCGKGFFQDKDGETLCIQCPDGETTLKKGSRSHSKCHKEVKVHARSQDVFPYGLKEPII